MVSYNYRYVTHADELPAIAQEVSSAPVLAEDFETTGFSPIHDKPRLWSINTGRGTYVIDLFKTGRPDVIIQAHKDNPDAIIAGQSLKFDQKFALYHYSLEFLRIFDSHRASQILHNGRHVGHDLYELYNRELGIGPQAPDLGGSDWTAGELTKDQLDYAAEDVTYIPRLREVLKVKLQAANLNRIAAIEFGAILPEAAIELNGFYLNPKKFRELLNSIKIQHDILQPVLWKKLPNPSNQMMLPGMLNQWNVDSNEQILAALRKLGVTQILKEKDSESGKFKSRQVILQNTSELTLAMVADEYPIIKDILDYRATATQLKMFPLGRGADPGYLKWVDSITGRIHPTYWPFLTSGRYSCSNPNLAQIPRDKRFRDCFEAEEGNLLVICDYSNVEMRIVAEISGDPVLIKVFRDGEDAHYYTAMLLTGKKKADITKPERQQAKPVNFGFIYGMMPDKLVIYALSNYGVHMTFKEAVEFRRKYFERFSGLGRWHARAQRDGQRQHEARSIWGRRRYLDGDFYNEYYNTPVQATGADGLKRGMRCVYERLKKLIGKPPCRTLECPDPEVKMCHHVHDELVTEVREQTELIEQVEHEVSVGMVEGIQPMLPHVPVLAEPSHGKTWADK